jgi:hypothetical protein
MNKISIKTLVPDTKYLKDSKTSIDIKSLVTINNFNSYEASINNFNIDCILKSQKEKREKLLSVYNKYYANCIEKIKLVHSANKYDLIFSVPNTLIENISDYYPKYCLDFIESKLKKNLFDTYRINNNTLFITWKYIESSI